MAVDQTTFQAQPLKDTGEGALPPEAEKILNQNQPDNGSGKGKASVIPAGIQGWGWGPFLWSWIWAIGNRVPLGFISLIPYVGIVMLPILGLKGREWAWRAKKWKSVEDFNKTQRVWSVTGFAFFVVLAVVMIWVIRSLLPYFAAGFAATTPIDL